MALCALSGRFAWGQEDNLTVFLLHYLSGGGVVLQSWMFC